MQIQLAACIIIGLNQMRYSKLICRKARTYKRRSGCSISKATASSKYIK